ncbi:MAG: HD-GYP domain-containing protein [Pseudomonadota bacterium]
METIRVKPGEIGVGCVLPWSAYDQHGRLLLPKGAIVASESQLRGLLSRGLYRAERGQPSASPALPRKKADPFQRLGDLCRSLQQQFRDIGAGVRGTGPAGVLSLGEEIQHLCAEDADAALGAVHLCHEHPYVVIHPIHVALLCELVAARLGYSAEDRRTILAAALTANVAMLELQALLSTQKVPLDGSQRRQIRDHPTLGVALLQMAGIDDARWLRIVAQHHEKIDGSGYPQGLRGQELMEEARIVNLADTYSAMVSPRAIRGPKPARDALREIFLLRGKEIDEQLALIFIKEIGVFPPGAMVRLRNGETAIVVRRGRESTAPIAYSVLGPQGEWYARPGRRDCSLDRYTIEEMQLTDNLLPIDVHALWGYD